MDYGLSMHGFIENKNLVLALAKGTYQCINQLYTLLKHQGHNISFLLATYTLEAAAHVIGPN